MNIKALKAFRLTLIEGSIAKASEKMHLSQSAISRLISSLEGELHLTLFFREGRRLVPTPQALAFNREAGRILDNLEEIRRIADEIRETQTERLRVLTMPRIAPALVSPTVARFLADSPDTRLKLDVRTRRDAEQWLVGREYDLGIGALPIEHPDIETEVLAKARAEAVIPASHPLADKTTISAEDLIDEPVISLLPGLLLRTQIEDFFHAAGHEKAFVCEVASSQLACHLAADGVGITLADALTASSIAPGKIVLRPIVPERWMSFGLLFPRKTNLSPLGEKFVSYLKEDIRSMANEKLKTE